MACSWIIKNCIVLANMLEFAFLLITGLIWKQKGKGFDDRFPDKSINQLINCEKKEKMSEGIQRTMGGARAGTITLLLNPQERTGERQDVVLELNNETENRQHVQWEDSVVDNEGLEKKKSKICCIYHPPRDFGESSDESSSSSDEDRNSYERQPKRKGKKHHHHHHHDDHDCDHDHDHNHEEPSGSGSH